MVRTKVFVGNLDFQTKESELVAQFGQAGKVISANIITRGPRSLGYGFVEMESEEDANKAVQLMHKKEIDGRPINVEVAKPRDETASTEPRSPSTRGSRGGRGRGRGGPRGESTRGESTRGESTRGESTRGAPRGGPRGSTRGGPRPAFRPRTDKPTSPTQQTRPPRREDDQSRPPSKTTLFVANLPFKMDDEQFAQVFKDAGAAYKSAHVVKNQRSGRSKGFGFVEFENEQDQLKALSAVNNKVVDERELVVKIALAEQQKPTLGAAEPIQDRQ